MINSPKKTVKFLICIIFANMLGGWSMNDEAAAHYSAIIDNMAIGIKFLQVHVLYILALTCTQHCLKDIWHHKSTHNSSMRDRVKINV